jgi:hypothetical protein
MIAYDATNQFLNWNVAGYRLMPIPPAPGPPIVATTPTPVPPGLRTSNFRGVYESILRRYGLDPLVQTEHDVLRAIVEHVNERLSTASSYWEWPQLTFCNIAHSGPHGLRPRSFKA